MSNRILTTFAIVIILVVFGVLYIFPAPDTRGPKCGTGEVVMFAQNSWWCVQVRKP